MKSTTNRNRLLAAVVFAFLACAAHAQVIDRIEAIVGSNTILLSDIENQVQQQKQSGDTVAECRVLEGLLVQKLLMAQAVLDSVQVSDDEVESELDRRLRYFANMAGGMQKLEQYYGKSVVQIKEEFRNDIKEQLLAQREQQQIVKDLKATPSDVRNFFNRIPQDSLPYYNATVEVGEIIFKPKVSPEVKALAKQQIEDLRKRVISGEPFSKLASVYSEDPGSRDNGGELGFTNRGELDPTFEAAAYALKNPGDMSDVIESTFGYHIIQLIERRGERINVRHILIVPKTTTFDIAHASAKADSVYQMIASGAIKFQDAAQRYSSDEDSKNNGGMLVNGQTNNTYFDVEQLGQVDPQLALSIGKMDVGTVSKPEAYKTQDGKMQYRILYLKSKTKAHRANLKDDYDKMQALAEQDKQNRTFQDWLREKRTSNYIRINSDFTTCTNLKEWINKQQR